MVTLPTFTPRPPETESEPLVETSKTGKVTDRRTVERVVRWMWPCSACGETAVVDATSGGCAPCWRIVVLLPWSLERSRRIAQDLGYETTGGTP